MSYTYIFFAAQINYCIHLRTRWNRKLQKVQVMTATRFWMLIQLASLSCICTYQGRRKVWKSGRASVYMVGIICPPGWDRVNWPAQILRSHGPLVPHGSDSPVSPFEAHLWEETENQQAIILPVNGHHKLLMLQLLCTAFCPEICT